METGNHSSQIVNVCYSSAIVTKDFYAAVVLINKTLHTEKSCKKFKPINIREREWHWQLVDGANITYVKKLCECINNFFASLTAGLTPLSASNVTGIHVGITAIPERELIMSQYLNFYNFSKIWNVQLKRKQGTRMNILR